MENRRLTELIKENVAYSIEGNVLRFVEDEESRPEWSKALNRYFVQNGVKLQMKRRYNFQRSVMNGDAPRKAFVRFVSEVKGVKVDLASGPSGYFASWVDSLSDDDVLIATDACLAVIEAHAKACNKENFYVFDLDLDQGLPFKDESVDIFTGNLLNNVANYAGLIQEAYRCLKKGGKLAVIELFFEHGCKTYAHLVEQKVIWSSFETFVAYCESLGFHFVGSDVVTTRKGKISEGDLYPLDENDCSEDRTVYFVKE